VKAFLPKVHEQASSVMLANAKSTTLLTAAAFLTHCGRVTKISVFNTVKLGTSASSS
jgi:hypothetical protein